jgi:hypothetical protein
VPSQITSYRAVFIGATWMRQHAQVVLLLLSSDSCNTCSTH